MGLWQRPTQKEGNEGWIYLITEPELEQSKAKTIQFDLDFTTKKRNSTNWRFIGRPEKTKIWQ